MTHPSKRSWLLAIDGSLNANRAADYVARWARLLHVSDVYLLNVQPVGSYRAYALHHNETILEAEEHGARATAVARKVLEDAQVSYRFHTGVGEPGDAIVGAATEEHAAEIVIGSRGLGAFANLALGSVAYKVLHLTEVPVTVVGNPHEEPHLLAAGPNAAQHVLLAVDGSEHAMRAVDYVRAFAAEGVPVEADLLNVQLAVQSTGAALPASQEVLDSRYREEGEAILRPSERALTKAGIRFRSHIRSGHVAQTIVQLAEECRCNRIVMGTRGLGAIANIVLGSVAYKVAHLASMPATLVK
jgi:nucleotide-binding universal stress UspA family protein